MFLTTHELTAASSAVAALAIVGGYLGVRSANHNALEIAREERSFKHEDDLNSLKRVTYARFITALTGLASASLEQGSITVSPEMRGDARISAIKKRNDALTDARNVFAELELCAPRHLCELASDCLSKATSCSRDTPSEFTRGTTELRIAMRFDLGSKEDLDSKELDRIASSSPTSMDMDTQDGSS